MSADIRTWGAGIFDISTIEVGNSPVVIEGAGPEVTILRVNTVGPIIRGQWDRFYQGGVILRNLTLVTMIQQPLEQFAVELKFQGDAASIVQQAILCENVTVRHNDLTQLGWSRGFALTSPWLSLFENVIVYGQTSARPTTTTCALAVYERSAGLTLRDFYVVGMDQAWQVYMGDTQGIVCDHVTAINCNRGLVANTSGILEPQVEIYGGSHFSCYQSCVTMKNCPQSKVDGLFYKAPDSDENWVGVDDQGGCQGTQFNGRYVNNGRSGTSTGVARVSPYTATSEGLYGQGLTTIIAGHPAGCVTGTPVNNGCAG